MAQQVRSRIVKADRLGEDIYELVFECQQMAEQARAGQFVDLYCDDASRLLPRPISICEVKDGGQIRLVYRTVGAGTKELANKRPGDLVSVLGPLGNGYPLPGTELPAKCAILLGGGVGIPPLLELQKRLTVPSITVLGYRSSETFLADEFKRRGKVLIASDDGSIGVKGTVLDALGNAMEGGVSLEGAVLYACGPRPMLRGVKEFAMREDVRAYLSLEERMACGIGACLGCVCETTGVNDHSKVHNARVCKDGPVFEAREVLL